MNDVHEGTLNNLLTEGEIAVLKQSIAEDLGIKLDLNEAKAIEFWRTIAGQKMQFKGVPDDNKPDELVKGGSPQLRMILKGKLKALKDITDKVKQAKGALGRARDALGGKIAKIKKAGRDAKKAGASALDQLATWAGDTI